MNFDKWFYEQNRLLQIILLIVPFVGWICEVLIRLSVMLRTKSLLHIIVFAVFVLVGWGWILAVIDLVYFIIKGHLILA